MEALPNSAIYSFWDDLFVDAESSMRTELLGAAPEPQVRGRVAKRSA